MPRIALGVEYDGRPYVGWQSQPAGNTVQDAVESAVARFVGSSRRIEVIAAGRTDAGVHALGQVVHVDVDAIRSEQAWVRGMNALLPSSISVRWARRVGDDFHARFSACRRTYLYRILNDPVRSPLFDGRAAWCFRLLDAAAMGRAAQALIGEHDFSSFRASACQAKSPVKHVTRLTVERRGRLIEVSIAADAFLHHMVRNIVGTLVYVGLGRMPEQWVAELLQARDRTRAAPTYAACGLYFLRVEYPAAYALPDIDASSAADCVMSR